MAVRLRTALLAAALVLGLAPLAARAQAAVPEDFFGVTPQGELVGEDYDRMGQAEVGTLRFGLFWAGTDPSEATGDLDWAAIDQIVGEAASEGVQTLPFVYGTPEWVAAGLDGYGCSGTACEAYAPKGAAARSAWSAFLRETVRRYGPGGQFWADNPQIPAKPIRAWQLWNEQNSPTFYKPKPKVKVYAKLLKAGGSAIAAEDPQAEIVLGGMFGTPLQGRKPAIAAWDYLEKLYKVKGAKKTFDGVAPHPYASKFSKVLAQIELVRDEMKDGGDRNADLWITELGWASDGPAHPLNRGPEGQADRLREAFKYFRKKRKKLNIRNVDWYSWRDNVGGQIAICAWCPNSGLLEQNFTPKPALEAFTDFTGGS